MNGGNQNSTSDGSSELLSFDVLIDRTTAEPATTAAATYPETTSGLHSCGYLRLRAVCT